MAIPKVFIGVGHGGSDPGAVANGFKEKDLNLSIALACQSELARHGVLTKLSRSVDEDESLNEKIRECNTFAPDLAMDIHNNAGGGDGVEVFYHVGGGTGKTFAEFIIDEVVKTGQNSRGVKTKTENGVDYFGFIRDTYAPAVIVECAFVDNATDIQCIDTAEEQTAMGIAIAKGALKTMGIAYKEEAAEDNTATDTKIDSVLEVQTWLNRNYASGLTRDGLYGSLTKAALVKALQKELGFTGADIDGIYGRKTNAAVKNLQKGMTGNLVKVLQGLLVCNKYKEAYVDGDFGNGTEYAVEQFQKKRGLTVDGIAGQQTFTALCA